MVNRIDFETKTDRELLVLVAQTMNIINEERLPAIVTRLNELNLTIDEHEDRLAKMETCNIPQTQISYRKLTAILTGITTGISTTIYFFGNLFDWW